MLSAELHDIIEAAEHFPYKAVGVWRKSFAACVGPAINYHLVVFDIVVITRSSVENGKSVFSELKRIEIGCVIAPLSEVYSGCSAVFVVINVNTCVIRLRAGVIEHIVRYDYVFADLLNAVYVISDSSADFVENQHGQILFGYINTCDLLVRNHKDIVRLRGNNQYAAFSDNIDSLVSVVISKGKFIAVHRVRSVVVDIDSFGA